MSLDFSESTSSLVVSVDAGLYSTARPLAYTVQTPLEASTSGADLVVALYSRVGNQLIGWQIVNQAFESSPSYVGSIDLSLVTPVDVDGVVLRAWQGTAGSAYPAGPTTGRTSGLRGGTTGFNVNSSASPSFRNSVDFVRRLMPGSTRTDLPDVDVDLLVATPSLSLPGGGSSGGGRRPFGFSRSRTAQDVVTKDGTILVNGLEPGARWDYSFASGDPDWQPGTPPADGSSQSAFALPEGSYPAGTVRVRQIDPAGNSGQTSFAAAVTVDQAVNPVGSLQLSQYEGQQPTPGVFVGSDNAFTLLATGNEAGSAVAYELSRDNGTSWRSTSSRLSRLPDGDYRFRAKVTDRAGNEAFTNTITVSIDRTAPVRPSLSLAPAAPGSPDQQQITVANLETTATWEYSLNSGLSWQPGSGDSFVVPSGLYPAVPATIRARQTDQAGNRSAEGVLSTPLAVDFLVDGDDTIQAAINAAYPGAKILVAKPDGYEEAVVVNKANLTIEVTNTAGLRLLAAPTSQGFSFRGGVGNDAVLGGNGADQLSGGDGNDVMTGGKGGDAINVGAGVNQVVQAQGDSVTAFSANLQSFSVDSNPANDRLFANGSTITFTNGVDVVTGANLVNGSSLRFVGSASANFVGDALVDGFYQGSSTSITADLVAAKDTAFAGQLINATGQAWNWGDLNTRTDPATFYLQGTFADVTRTFTVNAGPAYNGVGGGSDFLVFGVGLWSTTVNNAFFTGANANVLIFDDPEIGGIS